MPSQLQRVAQALVECLDQVPQVVEYLQRLAQRCRDNAGYIADISNHPAARNAALELDMAARCCDDAAQLLSMAPLNARAWAMQMVGGERTVEPARGGQRPSLKDQPAPPSRITDDQGRALQRRLPVRGNDPGYRPKTRGLWVDEDGQEHQLVSGESDFHDDVRQFLIDNMIGRSSGQLMVSSHVEAKFAMFMRLSGRMHETIAVNKLPCTGRWGCEQLVSDILPSDATLTVFGPDNFKRTYPLPPDERTDLT